MRHALLLIAGFALVGCNTSNDLNTEPAMSQVGAALPLNALTPAPTMFRDPNSTYVHGGEGLFRDSRARQVGDVLTVLIQMNDKAALDNSSERSRVSSAGFGAGCQHSHNLEAWLASIDRMEGLDEDARAIEQRSRRCLLEDRNARWIGQLETLFQDGPCLVAVGAVHLVGPEGLLAALRRDGYKVEAMPL